jgi:hypothetical protein
MRRLIIRPVFPILFLLLLALALGAPLSAQNDSHVAPLGKPSPTATLIPLFDPASPVNDSYENGVVTIMYFQAQRNLRLQKLVVFGEPQNQDIYVRNFYRIYLFKTNSEWGAPYGSGDQMLFSVEATLEDIGRNYYDMAVPSTRLEAGAYYYLVFQVNDSDLNIDWIQPMAENIVTQTGPFLTGDGRILVYGSCNPNIGPCQIRTPIWYLGTRK